MYDHWVAGELDKAREIHFGLHPVTDVIFTETNPAAAKWVLAQAGLLRSGFVRQPLVPLTEPGQRTALELLRHGAPVLEGPIAAIARGDDPPYPPGHARYSASPGGRPPGTPGGGGHIGDAAAG